MSWINSDEKLPEKNKVVNIAASMDSQAYFDGTQWKLVQNASTTCIVKFWREIEESPKQDVIVQSEAPEAV